MYPGGGRDMDVVTAASAGLPTDGERCCIQFPSAGARRLATPPAISSDWILQPLSVSCRFACREGRAERLQGSLGKGRASQSSTVGSRNTSHGRTSCNLS